jgi:hypothetical protein
MSANLVPVLVAIAVGPSINTPTGVPFASISVVVTDSSGTPQPPVLLTGSETPTPWAFSTSVNPGAGTVVATALDTNGATLGAPITQSFTEAGSPPTFQPPTGITVTPVTASVAAAASVKAAIKR